MVDTRNVTLASKSTFTTTVQKVGDRVTTTAPITVKNQIYEIRSIEDIPGVNTALRADGASLFYNANTGEYDIKVYNYAPLLNVQNLYVTTLWANNSRGANGQVLITNGNTVLWADSVTRVVAGTGLSGGGRAPEVTLSVNSAYIATITSNNATFAYGKSEANLSVYFSNFSDVANFALVANNTNFVGGQSVGSLNVNSAVYADYVLNLQLPNTSVVPGTYGNNKFIPVVTVDQYGRINAISTSAVAGVNTYTYSSGNNTFTIETGDGSIFRATIDIVKDFAVTGNLIVSGTTTTVNTQNLTVKDPVIRLNDGQLTPFNDIGIVMQRYAVSTNTNYNVAIGWDEDTRQLKFGRVPEDGSNNEISFSQEWMRIDENGIAYFLANTQAGNSVIAGTSMVINNVSFTERTYPGEANTALFFNGTIDCGSY
jgi:hypothetical protein